MPDEQDFMRKEPSFEGGAEAPQAAGTPRNEAPQGEDPRQDELNQKLQEALRRAQENQDAYLRARAEMENVRKRSQTDVANAHKYALENHAAELLPVRDSLEAALAAENSTLETLRSGVELTLKQLSSLFEKTHIREINPVGEKFDPHRHQAISMLPSDREPNTVINVLQKGYLLNDRVIRPALVTVARSKDA
jgi:molecular chaperone GrpE